MAAILGTILIVLSFVYRNGDMLQAGAMLVSAAIIAHAILKRRDVP